MQPAYQLTSVGAVADSQQQIGADVRRGTFVERASLDVIEFQRHACRGVHPHHPISMVSDARVARAGFGFGAARYGNVTVPGRDAASTPSVIVRPESGVDELGEDPVHDVIVQSSATARLVRFATSGGQLDLEEGSLLDVRLGEVDDEVVSEHQVGERMATAGFDRPVLLAVQAVPERQVGIEPRSEGTRVGVTEMERVLHVVEIADLEVAVDLVELPGCEHHVLHLGTPYALDPHIELSPGQRLGHDTH